MSYICPILLIKVNYIETIPAIIEEEFIQRLQLPTARHHPRQLLTRNCGSFGSYMYQRGYSSWGCQWQMPLTSISSYLFKSENASLQSRWFRKLCLTISSWVIFWAMIVIPILHFTVSL